VVDLFLARFEDSDRARWIAASEPHLSADEREQASNLEGPELYARHVIGRAALRVLAGHASDCEPRTVEVAQTPAGKPFLPDMPDLHVGVAHTGRLVAVAVCQGVEVGVDVETAQVTRLSPQRLVARFFAPQEAEAFARVAPDAAAGEFIRYWTIKEAVGKALGDGILPALSGVVVEASAGDGMHLVSVRSGPPADRWTVHQLAVPDGPELVAIALPAPAIALGVVRRLGLEELEAGRLTRQPLPTSARRATL
jgi:4'-phosphopantetheinyl transferase